MKSGILLLLFGLSSCAISHHVQVGDIERVKGKKLVPFNIRLSETGINLKQAASLVSTVSNDNGRAKEIQKIVALFQMGPRTGNPIYNEKYADILPQLILSKCPSGKVTGLMVQRETNKYPVVSGEIIRVLGYCTKG